MSASASVGAIVEFSQVTTRSKNKRNRTRNLKGRYKEQASWCKIQI